jgi:hypothetical protein
MPVGFAAAGPLGAAIGPRVVLGAGGAAAFVMLGLALLPRSTRRLGGARLASAEQFADDVAVEAGGEAEIA